MAPSTTDAIASLTHEELVALVMELSRTTARLERRLIDFEKASRLFATNAELDQPKGDPNVHFDPNGWRGDPRKGKPFSSCPPEYLDVLAEALASMADSPRPGKEQFAGANRHQARLARSWARRLRARAPAVAPPATPAAPRGPGQGAPRTAGRPAGARPGAPRPGAPGPASPAPVDSPAQAEDEGLAPPDAPGEGWDELEPPEGA